jgi:hypothetical protein
MTPWAHRPVSQLLSWARWLRLRHPGLRLTKLHIPLAATIAAGGALWLVPTWNFAHEFGVAHQVNGLLQIVAAFFIAALALVATFPGDVLDRPMGGTAPTLRDSEGDEYAPTRREFFGMMFGYLSAVSLAMYAVGAFAMSLVNPLPNSLVAALYGAANGYLVVALKAFYVGAVAHLLATTLLSLHFLSGFLSSSALPRDQPTPPASVTPEPEAPTVARIRRTG